MHKGGRELPVDDSTAHWAAHWAARIEASPETEHDPELHAWLAQHPRHAGALLRARAVLAMVVEAPGAHDDPATSTADVAPAKRNGWLLGIGGAIALSAAAALALWLPSPGMAVDTGLGEVRRLALADGSSLAIDARSSLKVSVANRGRRTVTMDGGRALFRVTHDAARPFQVTAGALTITDIGTVFEVSEDAADDSIEVVVSEGAVSVAGPHGTTLLRAGQRARFARLGPAPRVEQVDAGTLARTTAWTEGRLELDGETLGQALAEMNRHNQLQIRLVSPELDAEPLYGAFRLNDPTAFAQAVAASVGARSLRRDEGIVIAR